MWSWQFLITVSTQHSATIFLPPPLSYYFLLSDKKEDVAVPPAVVMPTPSKRGRKSKQGMGRLAGVGGVLPPGSDALILAHLAAGGQVKVSFFLSFFLCMQFFCFVCSCCCQASFVDCKLSAQHKVLMLLLSYIKIYCHFILYSFIYATYSSTTLLTHMTCRMMRMIIPTKMAQNPTGNLKMSCQRKVFLLCSHNKNTFFVSHTCIDIFRRGSRTYNYYDTTPIIVVCGNKKNIFQTNHENVYTQK